MTRYLVVVAGVVALCIFGVWVMSRRPDVRYIGQAAPAGVIDFEAAGTRFIICDLDTVDLYVAVEKDSVVEIRSLDLKWEDQ